MFVLFFVCDCVRVCACVCVCVHACVCACVGMGGCHTDLRGELRMLI